MNDAGDTGRPRESLGRGLGLFFLRFLAASIVLYAIYFFGGGVYTRFVALLATPLLAIFGYAMDVARALRIKEDISINPGVFLSLVIAVRFIAWRVKLRAAVIGVIVLTVVNAITLFLTFISAYRQSEVLWAGSEFLGLTINFFLPIVLWLALLPIRQAFPYFTIKRD
jgi:hypothetical protein